jgi:hypothetical protein
MRVRSIRRERVTDAGNRARCGERDVEGDHAHESPVRIEDVWVGERGDEQKRLRQQPPAMNPADRAAPFVTRSSAEPTRDKSSLVAIRSIATPAAHPAKNWKAPV